VLQNSKPFGCEIRLHFTMTLDRLKIIVRLRVVPPVCETVNSDDGTAGPNGYRAYRL